MPYNPQASFDIGGSVRAGQALVSPLQEALQKYEEQRKKTLFNQGVFDIMKEKTDSAGKPYIPVEAIARWDSLNPDKQAGYLSAAGSSMKEDLQKQQLDRQNTLADAQANLAHAKANQIWTGQDAESSLTLSPEEKAAAQKAGVVPLRQSRGSFQYKESPESAAAMRSGQPVYHPETGHVVGVYDTKGNPRFFAKEGTVDPMKAKMAEMMGGGAAPAATPAPVKPPTAATGGKVRVRRPDGQIGIIPAEQLPTALAQGYQQIQ